MNNFKTTDLLVRIETANGNPQHPAEMGGGRCPSPSKDKAWENRMKNMAAAQRQSTNAAQHAALTNLKTAIAALQQQTASC